MMSTLRIEYSKKFVDERPEEITVVATGEVVRKLLDYCRELNVYILDEKLKDKDEHGDYRRLCM